mmetsp:Transcript_37796/g.64788  ORF Transcript_37796/g.64788 Transcript_37796/m.64788 type:complete len:479 (+) Transcript_37796:941-2377(+)
MEVAVVVLLKLRSRHAVAGERRRRGQHLGNLVANLVVVLRRRRRRGGLLLRLLRVRLDLDPLLRHELGHHDAVGYPLEVVHLGPALEAVVEGAQVGGGANELHVQRVLRGEGKRLRRPLRARPEGRAAGGGHVKGEVEDELCDRVVVILLKLEPRPDDALVEGHRLVDKVGLDRLERRLAHAWLPLEDREEVGLREVRVHVLGALLEEALEKVAGPLDRVLDGVREVLERAHRDGLLRRVAARAVALGETRHHHLHVALGAEGAGLEQRLLVVHAALVDVQPRLDVVESVDHEVQPLPEGRVEDVFGRGRDAVLQRDRLEGGVHHPSGLDARERLGLADVVVAEEELTRQVGLLDDVVVRDGELALGPHADAHESESLDELAAERPRADEEGVEIGELRLERRAEDGHLRGVAAGRGGGRLGGRERLGRKALEGVEVEALADWVELGRARLDDLLPHDAAEDGGHRREHRRRARGELL